MMNYMGSFFNDYFVKPIITAEGYNVWNTLAYGLLLVGLGYLMYKFLKREKIKIDFSTFKVLLPYVVFAAIIHVLSDSGFYARSFFTVTPGIFLTMALFVFPCYYISKFIGNKSRVAWEKPFALIGIILAFSQAIYYVPRDFNALLLLLGFCLASSAPFFLAGYFIKFFRDKLTLAVLISHMIDSSSTIVSMNYYGYFEQHVVPALWIDTFGTFGFYIFKLIILLPLLYYLSRSEDKELANFVKIVFALFGLSAGLRTFLRLIMGV